MKPSHQHTKHTMGMDAYAVDHDGKRIPTREREGRIHPELVNAEHQREFGKAAHIVSQTVGWVDADLDVGELGISANASAVNHVMWQHGARCDDNDRYTAEQVIHVAHGLAADRPMNLPTYITEDKAAMAHAAVFIATCAKLGLGIEISP